jgi:DNA-binding NarL/FixJ family response regulator
VALNAMTIRCLIVDDQDCFLRSARDVLESDGIDVVSVAATSAEALQRAEELHPDVALIDIMLGAEFGFDLAYTFEQTLPEPPCVIMISTYAETDLADMITASPAIGFLSKAHLSGGAIRALVKNATPAH